MPIRRYDDLHPRTAKYNQYWARAAAAQARRRPGVIDYRYPRTDQPGWQDYWPNFPGTIIEKIVFRALVEARITFYFGPFWGDMPFTDTYERLRPDFILPEYRIVIECYGAYWHTIPGAVERDMMRAAMYTAAGYDFYVIWDYECYANPYNVLEKIPELRNPAIRTGNVFVSDRPFDPAASLRAQGRQAPKVVRTHKVREGFTVVSRRKVLWPYVKREKTKGESRRYVDLPDYYKDQLREYTREWLEYLDELGEYFSNWPRARTAYEKQYKYWAKWHGWYDRWQRLTDEDWDAYFADLGEYFTLYPDQRDEFMDRYYQWIQWKQAGVRRAW